MKANDRLIVGSFFLSSAVSLLWFILLAFGYSKGISGNISEILVTVLHLDGVLLGFGATFFAFLLARTEGIITEWGFAYATTARAQRMM